MKCWLILFYLFARFDSFLVPVEDDLPRVGILQPEGVVVNVEIVVVLPRQNSGKYLAADALVGRLPVVHRVLRVLEPEAEF